MANSDWASEAFGPLQALPTGQRVQCRNTFPSVEQSTDSQVGDLIEECEFVLKVIDTSECRACENWFYGDGLQCVEHGEEAAFRRSIGDTDWPN